MSYRITYGKTREVRTGNRIGKAYKHLIIWIMTLFIAISICWIGWSNSEIRQYILPGDPQITEVALEQLVLDIRNGESISDAIATFCQEIMDNAQTG